ncbi:MAG: ABC transporter ATP-binding protein [Lachnospiraceae bacterium]|nr:ABC transporter ATP-binding protein [Lachnospiraceae bacterium]
MIEAIELCKQFERGVREGRRTRKEEFWAVDHVSLKAEPGEIIGILGPNGAGKTTLLRMLGMLMTPTQGSVRITDGAGEELTELTDKKAAIGYLSGNTKLYPRFSIREYLQFLGELYGFDKTHIQSRIEEIFRVLDMEGFADNRIEKLSTGQMQRASISRCLMADPKIYILDEPTLGLDILSADAIINFMKKQKENGKTVLYSTHYLEEAQFLCDRIYMICSGRIVACGTPEDLMEQTGCSSLRDAFHAIYEEEKTEDRIQAGGARG